MGLVFLLNGNMCNGVHSQAINVRLHPEQTYGDLSIPHTRIFDLTGQPLKGWILVGPTGLAQTSALM